MTFLPTLYNGGSCMPLAEAHVQNVLREDAGMCVTVKKEEFTYASDHDDDNDDLVTSSCIDLTSPDKLKSPSEEPFHAHTAFPTGFRRASSMAPTRSCLS